MASDIESVAAETAPLEAELRDLQGLADGFGRAMTTAFRKSVVDGKRLEDVLKSLALSLSSRALNSALAPIGQGIASGLFGTLASRIGSGGGGALRSTSAAPAASVQRGIAQPSNVHVTFNVSAPDAASFRRAEADVSAMLARAVARGQRGM